MVCQRCGQELPTGTTSCPTCGLLFAVVSPSQPDQDHITIVDSGNSPFYPLKNNRALATEILFSLFGIYGVGWLLAGKVGVGIALLLGSLLIFWPLIFILAIFTDGLGLLFCDLPLAFGGIILNALLLNRVLQRKAARIATIQTQQWSQASLMPRSDM